MKNKRVKRYRNPSQRLNKWGLIFIIPFIVAFLLFQLYPIVNSFILAFTNDNDVTIFGQGNLEQFNILSNFKLVICDSDYWHCYFNTIIIFAMNFVPQIVSALFFAALFTSRRIRMRAKGFFQFVYFLPNILTATTVAALFVVLLDRYKIYDDVHPGGPIYELFVLLGMNPDVKLLNDPWANRIVIAFIQFWMWFGNSMVVYVAGIKGISNEVFEAADLDGANSLQIFFNITLSILKPIMLYSLITSLIGGLQMFDIQMMLRGTPINIAGETFEPSKTIAMYIYEYMTQRDYGIASAASIILFIFSLGLSILMYFLFFKEKNHEKRVWKKVARL